MLLLSIDLTLFCFIIYCNPLAIFENCGLMIASMTIHIYSQYLITVIEGHIPFNNGVPYNDPFYLKCL